MIYWLRRLSQSFFYRRRSSCPTSRRAWEAWNDACRRLCDLNEICSVFLLQAAYYRSYHWRRPIHVLKLWGRTSRALFGGGWVSPSQSKRSGGPWYSVFDRSGEIQLTLVHYFKLKDLVIEKKYNLTKLFEHLNTVTDTSIDTIKTWPRTFTWSTVGESLLIKNWGYIGIAISAHKRKWRAVPPVGL